MFGFQFYIKFHMKVLFMKALMIYWSLNTNQLLVTLHSEQFYATAILY